MGEMIDKHFTEDQIMMFLSLCKGCRMSYEKWQNSKDEVEMAYNQKYFENDILSLLDWLEDNGFGTKYNPHDMY